MTPLWDDLFTDNANEGANTWSSDAVRYAMRAFVSALNNADKETLERHKGYLRKYMAASRHQSNHFLREAFSMSVPVLLNRDGLVLNVLHNDQSTWENMIAFCESLSTTDLHNVPSSLRRTMLGALGTIGTTCLGQILAARQRSTFRKGQKRQSTILEDETMLPLQTLGWVTMYLLDAWCQTNYLSIRLECCSQIRSIARANCLTVTSLFDMFVVRISKEVLSQLLCPDSESDTLRFYLFTEVFLDVGERKSGTSKKTIDRLLRRSIDHVLPVLIIRQDKVGLSCLAKIWPKAQPAQALSQTPQSSDSKRASKSKKLDSMSNELNTIVDLLLEYSCPIVAEILLTFSQQNGAEESSNPFAFVLNHINRTSPVDDGWTITEYIDESFFPLVAQLVWLLGEEDDAKATAAVHALKAMATILVKGNSKKIQLPADDNNSLEPFDALLRQYFLYMLNTIQLRLKSSESTANRRRSLRVLQRVLELLVESEVNAETRRNASAKKASGRKAKVRKTGSRVKSELDVESQRERYPGSDVLGQYVPPILVTLKRSIEDVSIQEGAAVVWKYFVSRINDDTACKNLNAIVVNLLPCLDMKSRSTKNTKRCIVETLRGLIVERELPKEYLSTLPLSPLLLEADPDIKKVLRADSNFTRRRVGRNVDTRLTGIIELLAHDSPAVRLTALHEIKRVLEEDIISPAGNSAGTQGYAQSRPNGEKGARLHSWLIPTADGEVSNIARRLLQALFQVAQSASDAETQLACAECLGQIGAIDPSRFQGRAVIAPKRLQVFRSKQQFAAGVITNCLVRALRAASNTRVHDCVAYAIQEGLKLMAEEMGLSSKKGSSARRTLSNFPKQLANEFNNDEEILEVIRPYWTTNLQLQDIDKPQKGPFYPRMNSFEEWLGIWTRYLIREAKGPLNDVFKMCRTAIMKGTTNSATSTKHTALFLLPHLIRNVLAHGDDDDLANLQKEILLIVQPTSSGNQGSENLVGKLGTDNSSTKRILCAQEIFSLIDELSKWHEDQLRLRDKERQRGRRGRHTPSFLIAPKEALEKCVKLLNSIPNKELSHLALDCNAHARALLYFERHVRETRDPYRRGIAIGSNCIDIDDVSTKFILPFSLDEISYARKIYARIDEPDGMRGFMSLRSKLLLNSRSNQGGRHISPTSELQEHIIDHEYAQEWSEALTCYEQVLSLLPSSRDPRPARSTQPGAPRAKRTNHWAKLISSMNVGILNCLLNVGNYETLLHHALGVMKQDPSLIKDLSPISIEAAWRLGKWDLLETLLHGAAEGGLPHDNYNFQIGNAFFAMQQQRSADFYDALGKARISVMGALSAASMESYERAYPMLLRLHALHEMEQGFSLTGDRFGNGAAGLRRQSQDIVRAYGGISENKVDLIKKWEWDERLESTSPSVRLQEPLFAVRRVTYQMNRPSLSVREGEEWIKLAKVSLASGHLRGASIALMHAETLNLPGARIERAHLLRQQAQLHKALELLDPGDLAVVANLLQQTDSTANERRKNDVARRTLMYTNWKHEAGLEVGQAILKRYSQVTELSPGWSDGHFHLGKYYDFLLQRQHDSGGMPPTRMYETIVQFIIHYYGKSLRRGSEYIHEALPRLLSLWFDFGSRFHEIVRAYEAEHEGGAGKKGRSSGKRQMSAAQKRRGSAKKAPVKLQGDAALAHELLLLSIKQIKTLALPEYQWMTVFPQLASRLGHESDHIADALVQRVSQIVSRYPQQVLWSLVGITNTTVTPQNANRASRAHLAMERATKHVSRGCNFTGAEIKFLWEATSKSCTMLIELAGIRYGKDSTGRVNVNQVFPKFDDAFNDALCSHAPTARGSYTVGLIVPNQSQLMVDLPRRSTDGEVPTTASTQNHASLDRRHHGFSTSPVTITKFMKDVKVQLSKEQPKRITLRGSDGQNYHFLCKRERKGDLRKDERMMETFTLANRLLQRDPEGRRRQLRVRTYAVTCVNHQSGILEWVPHTTKFRSVVGEVYRDENFSYPFVVDEKVMNEIVRIQGIRSDTHKLKEYRENILQKFPPRMHNWFTKTYPVPTQWFEARLRFARSSAAWSMIGHIVGLGDRHSENILIDTTTGECVHVDFDCIFDKGILALARPEIVPFRLTPQVVDGLGITGYEGVFRGSCEATMRVLRSNRDMVLSVLEAFLHDPVVDFGSVSKGKTHSSKIAMKVLDRTKKRLNGVYNYHPPKRGNNKHHPSPQSVGITANMTAFIPLSIEGQVQKLIDEATNELSLVEMFYGWMAFA